MKRQRRPKRRAGLEASTLLQRRDQTEPIRRYAEPVTQPFAGAQYQPAPYSPQHAPRTHSAAGTGWQMTVNTDGPGVPWNPRTRKTRAFLDLKVGYLEAQDMGYRVDEAEEVMQRGEEIPPGSIMADAHREGVTHLMGPREPWEPAGGWDHGWAGDLPWYRPEDGDNGEPVHRAPQPEPPGPWHDPADPSGVRAAYDHELGGDAA